jgi:cysteine-rich repeat protein
VTPSTCHAGACLDDECGNALIDATEACDDANVITDDGCSLDCRSTNVCGNEIVDVPLAEECDTGDPREHDGCSSGCRLETPHWQELGVEHPNRRPPQYFSDQRLRDSQLAIRW